MDGSVSAPDKTLGKIGLYNLQRGEIGTIADSS